MPNFVTDNPPLPPQKVDAEPPKPGPSTFAAADVNNMWAASGDLRAWTIPAYTTVNGAGIALTDASDSVFLFRVTAPITQQPTIAIPEPTGAVLPGQTITLLIFNDTDTAIGAASFDPVFHLVGPFSTPGPRVHCAITFEFDGTSEWYELSRTTPAFTPTGGVALESFQPDGQGPAFLFEAANPLTVSPFAVFQRSDGTPAVTVKASGEIDAGNVLSSGNITATGTIAANAVVVTTAIQSSTVNTASLQCTGDIDAAGDITGATAHISGTATTGSLSTGQIVASGSVSVTGVTTLGTVNTTNVSATGDVSSATMHASGDVAAATLHTTGAATVGSLSITTTPIKLLGTAPSNGAAFQFGNTTAITGFPGRIASFYSDNFINERAYVDRDGSYVTQGGLVLNVGLGATISADTSVNTGVVTLRGGQQPANPTSSTSIFRFGNSFGTPIAAPGKIISLFADNFGTERFFVDGDGNVACAGAYQSFSASVPVTLKSLMPDGATALGVVIDTTAAYTAGTGARLISVRTGGAEKMYIDPNGSFVGLSGGVNVFAGTFMSSVGQQTVQIKGQLPASSTGIANKLGNSNALGATGKIASFYSDNLVTEKAYIDASGVANFSGVVYGASFRATGSATPTLVLGRATTGGPGTALRIGNETALTTAGDKITSFYSDNMTTEKAYVDLFGAIKAASYDAFAAGATAQHRGSVADGASAIASKFGNANALTTAGAKIASFYSDNLTTEKLAVDLNGAILNPTAGVVLRSSTPDGANAVHHIFDTTTNQTGGTASRIADFRNNGSSKAGVDVQGNFITASSYYGVGITGAGTNQVRLVSQLAAGTLNAYATRLGNLNVLTDPSSRITGFFNDATLTTPVAFVALDGRGSFNGGISPGTDALAAQSGKFLMGSTAPNNANGNNGDYFFRTDTPGTANQRIYVKNAGAWTGIV